MFPANVSATDPTRPGFQPTHRWTRVAIVLLGIILGQLILYGPSLAGKKILLPLDILAQPLVYIPVPASGSVAELQDDMLKDLVLWSEPARRFAVAELHAGRWPMWTPYQFAGAPFMWPKYSPFKLFECCTASPVILAWSQLLVSLVAGLGVYRFFRRALGLGFWAATIPAWCYPLTAFFVFWQGYTSNGAIYWLPWILLAVDATVRRCSWKSALGLSGCTCLVIISGHLDIAGQVLLIAGLYSLWCLWDLHRAAWWRSRAAKAALALSIGWTLGFLLAMPYLLPLLEYAQTGSRMARRNAGTEERPPIGLAALPTVVLPDMHGATAHGTLPIFPAKQRNIMEGPATAYAGVGVTLFLAPLAFVDRRYRAGSIFWLGIGVLGIGWCLDLPGIVDVLRLPGLNLMSHNRLTFATAFASLTLAAIGLETLARGDLRWRRWFWGPLGILVALGGWCLWWPEHLPGSITTDLAATIRAGKSVGWVHDLDGVRQVHEWFRARHHTAAFFCAAGAMFWVWVGWGKSPRLVVVLAGVLSLGELLRFAHGRNPQSDPALDYPPLPALEQFAKGSPDRLLGYLCLPAALPQLNQWRDVRGYDAIDPARLMDLMAAASAPDAPTPEYAQTQWFVPQITEPLTNGLRLSPLLDMLATRYLIFRGQPPPDVRPAIRAEDYWVLVNSNALPRVFVPRRVETATASFDRLTKLKSPDFDPRAVAYVETEIELPPACRGTAVIAGELPTQIKINVTMETPGLVVLADLWDKGWRAYLDGQPTDILCANHALRGVRVPTGPTTLEFRYEPASFRLGLKLALAAVVILAGWSAIGHWRQRTNQLVPGTAQT